MRNRSPAGLWAAQHLPAQADLAGQTMPAMFWTAVQQRADNIWMRQKELGIWQS